MEMKYYELNMPYHSIGEDLSHAFEAYDSNDREAFVTVAQQLELSLQAIKKLIELTESGDIEIHSTYDPDHPILLCKPEAVGALESDGILYSQEDF